MSDEPGPVDPVNMRPPNGAKLPDSLFSCGVRSCELGTSHPPDMMYWSPDHDTWFCEDCYEYQTDFKLEDATRLDQWTDGVATRVAQKLRDVATQLDEFEVPVGMDIGNRIEMRAILYYGSLMMELSADELTNGDPK